MAYIGHTPAEKYVSLSAQHFTVTATANYTLSNSVTNENEIALFINNVRQQPGGSYAYTAAGTTLTLSAATAGTDTMYCVYLGKAVGTINPPDGSVNSATIVDGSITDGDLAGSISSAKITSLDATKLTGTVAEARLATLDASKLTGSIADARVPASAVTQHVTATDLTPIRQDLAMLALYNAVSDNRAAYNLPSSFIDQFEDDTGLTTQTNVDRNIVGEYTDTNTTSASVSGTKYAVTSGMMSHLNMSSWNAGQVVDGATTSNTGFYFGSGNSSGYVQVDLGAANDQAFGKIRVYMTAATNAGVWTIAYSDDGSSWTNTDLTNFAPGAGSTNAWFEGTWTGVSAHRYWKMFVSAGNGAGQGWYSEIEWYAFSQTTNATGTLISDTQTAPSATTETSGVILYTDNAGTNVLGTDLKIYMTANNGTNWTEAASYGTPQTFSGTTKQVKLGKTTVTSGTQVALKAVWANQVATVPAVAAGYETGDRRASITVTHSGFASFSEGQPNSLIVDGGNADAHQVGSRFVFASSTPSAGAYIRFQFSTAKVITEAKWVGCTSATGVWKWQGSNDGSSFTDIGSSFTLQSDSGWQGSVLGTFMTMTSLSGNTTSYLYYQIAWVSGATYGGDYQVEVEFKVAAAAAVAGKEAHLNGWAVNY